MIDWTKVGRAETHSVRVQILEAFGNLETISPNELAELGCGDLSTVAYHVKALERKGILKLTETRPARGATEHFYVVAEEYRA